MDTRTLAMLHNPVAMPTTLLMICIDQFGVECMDWLPHVLEGELQGLAKSDVPQRNFDRLHGLILALTTDRFYVEPKIFIEVCDALAPDGPVMFGVFDPPETREMAWAVTEMRLHDPGTDEVLKDRYDDEVLTAMRLIMADEGFITPPQYLSFAGSNENVGPVGESSPGLHDATWQVHIQKADEVDRWVQERFSQLMGQLKRIDLDNGDMSDIDQMIDAIIEDA